VPTPSPAASGVAGYRLAITVPRDPKPLLNGYSGTLFRVHVDPGALLNIRLGACLDVHVGTGTGIPLQAPAELLSPGRW
jgi:hypothetical protein